jgi:uncharacterized protein
VRVVYDTNVLVAAFAAEGLCATLLRRAKKGQVQLILCPVILEEFQRVVRKKFSATSDEVRDAMALIREAAEPTLIVPAAIPRSSRDRADDATLGCALAAQADVLVTGDNDLLVLGTFQAIRLLSPRDFEALCAD